MRWIFFTGFFRSISFSFALFEAKSFKLDSHLPNLFYLLQCKLFKNDEKCFLFYLNSSIFSLDLWSCRKNALIRNKSYNWIELLLNISRSKGNQTQKIGQFTEYNKRNIFLQKVCRKWGRETSSRPKFVF